MLRLDWKYALGELIIVTAGVLIALGVDEWRQGINDDEMELAYIARIKSDLREDIERYEDFINVPLRNKRIILESLQLLDPDNLEYDYSIFTTANLRYSTYKAIPEVQSGTFREMTNAGNFRLISDQELRMKIDGYYENYQLMAGILQQSPGNYERLLSASLPGKPFYISFVEEMEMPQESIRTGIMALLLQPELNESVNTELYYAASMTYWMRDISNRAKDLLNSIEQNYSQLN